MGNEGSSTPKKKNKKTKTTKKENKSTGEYSNSISKTEPDNEETKYQDLLKKYRKKFLDDFWDLLNSTNNKNLIYNIGSKIEYDDNFPRDDFRGQICNLVEWESNLARVKMKEINEFYFNGEIDLDDFRLRFKDRFIMEAMYNRIYNDYFRIKARCIALNIPGKIIKEANIGKELWNFEKTLETDIFIKESNIDPIINKIKEYYRENKKKKRSVNSSYSSYSSSSNHSSSSIDDREKGKRGQLCHKCIKYHGACITCGKPLKGGYNEDHYVCYHQRCNPENKCIICWNSHVEWNATVCSECRRDNYKKFHCVGKHLCHICKQKIK